MAEDQQTPMSGQDLALMGIQTLESMKARLEMTERELTELRRQGEVTQNLTREIEACTKRMARAEEDRSLLLREAESNRKEEARAQLAARSVWFDKLWANQSVQLLLMGLVMFVLQMLGLSWMVNKMGAMP